MFDWYAYVAFDKFLDIICRWHKIQQIRSKLQNIDARRY